MCDGVVEVQEQSAQEGVTRLRKTFDDHVAELRLQLPAARLMSAASVVEGALPYTHRLAVVVDARDELCEAGGLLPPAPTRSLTPLTVEHGLM
jgi:hypothetical protein